MYQNSSYRWFVLFLFGAVIGTSQMLSLNFAPLVTTLQSMYGVSDFMAGLPTLMNPLTYLLVGFHAGIALDHHGYKKVVAYSAVLMTISAYARSFDMGYTGLLVTHLGISIAGVYITSSIAKVVSDWFPPESTAMATGVAMAGMLIGIGIGMGGTAFFVAENGLFETMRHYAVLSLIVTILFIAFCRENLHALIPEGESGTQETMALFKDKNLLTVFILSFLVVGATNAFNTWFEKIMSVNGFDPEQAGYVIGILLLSSIIGAALIPPLSDRVGRRKPFLLLAIFFGILLTYPLFSTHDLDTAFGLAAMGGMLQMPGYILIITLAAEFSGPARAGLANGIVMLTSSVGGLLIAILMERIGAWFGWEYSAWVLVATFVLAFLTATKLEEPTIGEKSQTVTS